MNGVRTLIKFLRPLDNIDFSLGSLKIQLFLSFFFFFFPSSFISVAFTSPSRSSLGIFRGKIYIYIYLYGALSSTRDFYFFTAEIIVHRYYFQPNDHRKLSITPIVVSSSIIASIIHPRFSIERSIVPKNRSFFSFFSNRGELGVGKGDKDEYLSRPTSPFCLPTCTTR